jgi:hypothetical protein
MRAPGRLPGSLGERTGDGPLEQEAFVILDGPAVALEGWARAEASRR